MPSCSLLHIVFPEVWTYASILTLSISLSCTYETQICTKFSLTWDITSSLCLLILVSYAEMARALKKFPSSSLEFSVSLYFSMLLITEVLGRNSGLIDSSEAGCSRGVVLWHLREEEQKKIWGLACPQIQQYALCHGVGSIFLGLGEQY